MDTRPEDSVPEMRDRNAQRSQSQIEGERRRKIAVFQFPAAQAFAKEQGFELIRHTDVHYKIKTPHWSFEVYPGNRRIWTGDRNAPNLIRHMSLLWTLRDAVSAAAKELKKMPKKEVEPVHAPEPLREFKNASILASGHKFRLVKHGNIYKAIAHGWALELHPDTHEVVRVNDKGPHLELPKNWTLMDVVRGIIKKMEKV